MTRRTASIIGWGSFGLGAVAFCAAVALPLAAAPHLPEVDRLAPLDVVWAASILAIPLTGPIIVSRRPDNLLGWLLCAVGLGLSFGLFGSEYGHYVASGAGDLPAAPWLAWSSFFFFPLAYTSLAIVLLLFPNGRLASPRLRWLVGAILTASTISTLADAFQPGRFEGRPTEPVNPVGIHGADFLAPLSDLAFGVFAFCALLGGLTTFVRFRRAQHEERQQLKWVALGAVVFVGLIGIVLLLDVAGLDGTAVDTAGTVAFIGGMGSIAAGVAIAVLKYRLYNIDLVINRTLVYLVLTILLGLVYFGGVTLLQGLLGLGDRGELAVAASTLAVAGLFQPARRRIQDGIDHLFYRRKYDAQVTVDDFSRKLRDQIDLEVVTDEMVAVVSRTMQPSSISVWVRTGEAQ